MAGDMNWNYYALMGAFNGLIALSVGGYLLWRDRKNVVSMSFFSFAASVAFWSIAYAVWQIQTDRQLAMYWMGWVMFFCCFVPFSFFWFARAVVGYDKDAGYLYFIAPIIFGVFCWHPAMIDGVAKQLNFEYWPVPGPLMHLFMVVCNGLVIYAFVILIKFWKISTGNQRQSLGWIIATTLLAWTGGSTNWFLWYGIPIPPIPHFFVGVSFLLMGYGILRMKLFDLDVLASLARDVKLSAIGTMSASINHELKSPLYVIKTRAQMCLEGLNGLDNGERTSKIQKCISDLDTVQREASRALDIVQRFTDFMRQKEDDFKAEQLTVLPIVNDVLWLLDSEIQNKQTQIVVCVPDDFSICFMKRDFEEVLFNLIRNACEAVPAKNGCITIKCKRYKDQWCLDISDNGSGVDPTIRRQLFSPFVTHNKRGGTGLGLYITKLLIEKNAGQINIHSRVNGGTSFVIMFKKNLLNGISAD